MSKVGLGFPYEMTFYPLFPLFRRKAYNGQNLVASYSYDRIVIPPTSMPNLNYQSEVLSRENTDYSSRSAFHSSTLINPSFN